MKLRTPLALAAAALAAGLAAAQPVQLLLAEKRAYPAQPAPTSPSTEYKPPANADPDPKSLTVPDDLQKQAKDLVGKLSSPVYAEREKATRELAKMGRMALPALQEALGSATEPEVALRAEGLLPKAEADDMKARVGSFLADTDGKHQHTLPGWERFKTVCGNDRASRKLFAEMLKSTLTHQMLLAADKTAEEVNGVLNQYVTRLMYQQNGGFRGGWGGGDGGGVAPHQAKLPDMVAALFLEGLFTDREVMVQASTPWNWGNQGNQSVTNYMYNVPEVSNALSNSGEYAAPIRKIIIQWMDSRETSQQAYQAWSFSNTIFGSDPKKRMKYACRVLEAEGGGQNGSNYRHSMLSSLASNQVADLKTIVPSIAKCFDDGLLLWSAQNGSPPNFDIQLRDYALAFALQVTDQKPEDYGMTRNGTGTGNQLGNMQAFYFKDDNPPKVVPGGGGGFRGGKGGRFVEPVEEPVKKDEPKKEEPKDPKKEEPAKKVSQDDRRKIAFKKWEEWVKAGGLTEVKKDPKAEPKKDGSKPDEPKKDEPKKPEEPKKELPQAQPAVQPLPAIKR